MSEEKRKELIRVAKFIGFPISAGVIELLSFTLLNELTSRSYWPCYLIALILSVLWNFTLNRKFTFQSANDLGDKRSHLMAQSRHPIPNGTT